MLVAHFKGSLSQEGVQAVSEETTLDFGLPIAPDPSPTVLIGEPPPPLPNIPARTNKPLKTTVINKLHDNSMHVIAHCCRKLPSSG